MLSMLGAVVKMAKWRGVHHPFGLELLKTLSLVSILHGPSFSCKIRSAIRTRCSLKCGTFLASGGRTSRPLVYHSSDIQEKSLDRAGEFLAERTLPSTLDLTLFLYVV
jgi:hypothetical protein